MTKSGVKCCGTCGEYSISKGKLKIDNVIASNACYGLCYIKGKTVFIFNKPCDRYIVDSFFRDLVDRRTFGPAT